MNNMNCIAAALVLAGMPAIAQAQAASTCVTRAEANALFASTLPDIVDGVRNKCEASLPASAFLRTEGHALVARYRSAGSADWSAARSGFVKIVGSGGQAEAKMIAAMPDAVLKGFLGTAFASVVTDDIKLKDCAQIDRFVSALSPLPASNIGEIVTGLIALSGSDKKEPFQLCKDS